MKKKNKAVACSLSAAALLAGCAVAPPLAKTEKFTVGGIDMLSTSAEQQIVLFHSPENIVKVCLVPPPDAVATFGENISLGVKGTGVGESESDGAAVLGGRGPTALIARDLLFRTCELSLNYKLTKDEALQLYRQTLSSIEKMSAAPDRLGSASLSATPFPVAADSDSKDP